MTVTAMSTAKMVIITWTVTASTTTDGSTVDSLRRGVKALEQLRVGKAIDCFEAARTQGPYTHADHVLLYERLGMAYAYAGNNEAAQTAFARLLALDPGHVIPYTLSPRVTFLFQKARNEAAKRPPATVELTWSPFLEVTDSVSIFVEIVADPANFLHNAVLFTRRKGEATFRAIPLRLAPPGQSSRVDLGVVAREATSAQTLELYMVAKDARGSEVLQVGNGTFPRQIALAYEEPLVWYQRWWVWAVVGAVATGAGAAIVYAATYKPPQRIGGTFEVR